MATLNLTYDTGSTTLAEINDAVALEYNYQATINGSPNPESKSQFSRRMIGEHIKYIVKHQRTISAVTAAENSVTNIILT